MALILPMLLQLLQPGNAETMEPISGSHLVELSVLATHGQEQIQVRHMQRPTFKYISHATANFQNEKSKMMLGISRVALGSP